MPEFDRRSYVKATGLTAIGALAGCLGRGDDEESDGVKAGLIRPVGNPTAEQIETGVNYAIDEINADGGLLGGEIELVLGDSQGEASTAANEARRLVEQENVDVLMGPQASEWTLAAQEAIKGEDVLFMDGNAGTTDLNARVRDDPDQYGHWFTIVPRTPEVFEIVGQNFEEYTAPGVGTDHAVAVMEDVGWTAGAAESMNSATSDDITIDSVRFSYDVSDFTGIFNEAMNTGADVMICGITLADETSFVTQWADSEIPMAIDGFIPASTSSAFADQVGDDAYGVGSNLAGAEAPITDKTMDFVEGYRDEYGNSPPTYSWLLYDTVQAWSGAMRDAETTDIDELISTLEEGSWTGAIGKLQFRGTDHEYAHGPITDPEDGVWYTLGQWQRNDDDELQRVMVGPDAWADHDGEQDFVTPEWM